MILRPSQDCSLPSCSSRDDAHEPEGGDAGAGAGDGGDGGDGGVEIGLGGA